MNKALKTLADPRGFEPLASAFGGQLYAQVIPKNNGKFTQFAGYQPGFAAVSAARRRNSPSTQPVNDLRGALEAGEAA